MEARIRQIVDTLYVPLPAEIVLEANLKPESVVDLAVVNGNVIVHPTTGNSYSFEQLLAGITEENIHKEIDFGAAVGKEVW